MLSRKNVRIHITVTFYPVRENKSNNASFHKTALALTLHFNATTTPDVR